MLRGMGWRISLRRVASLTLVSFIFLGRAESLAQRSGVRRPLPKFSNDGYLPPGIHKVSISELAQRLATGPRRAQLTHSLLRTLAGLREAGVAKVFIGGSFVSTKPVPGDVDILFRKGHPFKWNPFIRTARRAYAQDIHIYDADRRVTDALSLQLTSEQRAAWSSRTPTFLELFQNTRSGAHVGVVEVDLKRPWHRRGRHGRATEGAGRRGNHLLGVRRLRKRHRRRTGAEGGALADGPWRPTGAGAAVHQVREH